MTTSRSRTTRTRRRDIYRSDLAYIHHNGFGDFARNCAGELLRLLRQKGLRRGILIDLGCGSGLWARAARQAGFNVIGIDQSPAMIQLARQVAPDARFHCVSLHNFKFPACDVVTILGEGLNYVRSTKERTNQLAPLFRRIARALRPGGMFLFDVIVDGRPPLQNRNWRAGRDWAVLTEATEKSAQRLLVRRIITFRKIGRTWRREEETHRVRVWQQAVIRNALSNSGFSLRMSRRYGKVPLLPRRVAFIARKLPAHERVP